MNMNEESKRIVQRANALNISIAYLCREAGVSRGWFEKLKYRIPKSTAAYLKILERLNELENGREL